VEIDGKKYYQKASQQSCIKEGKELFEWLAEQEDGHRQKFEQVYKVINDSKAWPEVDISAGKQGGVDTIFAQTRQATTCKIKTPRAELNTIAKAMEMENKTYDFYKKQAEASVYEAQEKFYKTVAAEEKKHYLALVDYKEYIIDPTGWLTKTEHHSLDGG
jgi:rubrerythrin